MQGEHRQPLAQPGSSSSFFANNHYFLHPACRVLAFIIFLVQLSCLAAFRSIFTITMKLPSNVILLVVEYLDWGTLRSLLATCRTIRLVLLTYQHSISKAWIARHLPNPAPPFTLIFSSRKEDPFTGGPAIINSPNFEAIEELEKSPDRRILHAPLSKQPTWHWNPLGGSSLD
jgi:hypothetical protein